MQTQFKSLRTTLEKLMGEMGEKEEARLYQRYYGLLQKCLPENWRHNVLLTGIDKGYWFLGVKTRQDAYLLQFLLPDLQDRLAQHLKNPPKLKIKADPHYWAEHHREQICAVRIDKRHFSDEEVQAILRDFITR